MSSHDKPQGYDLFEFSRITIRKTRQLIVFLFFCQMYFVRYLIFFYKLDKKDPKNEKGFVKRNRKKTVCLRYYVFPY